MRGDALRTRAEHKLPAPPGVAEPFDAAPVDGEESALFQWLQYGQREVAGQKRRQFRAKTYPTLCDRGGRSGVAGDGGKRGIEKCRAAVQRGG